MRPRWIFRVTLQDLIDDEVSWNKQVFYFRNLEIHSGDVMVSFCKAEIFIHVLTLACSSYLAIELIFCQRCKPAKHEWQTSVVPMIPRCPSSKGHKNSTEIEIMATLINIRKDLNSYQIVTSFIDKQVPEWRRRTREATKVCQCKLSWFLGRPCNRRHL